MSQSIAPADIARETLRRLAADRLQPTPDNYARVYAQIARLWQSSTLSTIDVEASNTQFAQETFRLFLEESIQTLAEHVPNSAVIDLFHAMALALKRPGWEDFQKVCQRFLKLPTDENSEFKKTLDWSILIGRLIEVYLFPHPMLTSALKRDQLEEALKGNEALVYRQLFELIRYWEAQASAHSSQAMSIAYEVTGHFSRTINGTLRELFGETLKTAAATYASHIPEAQQKAEHLSYLIRTADSLEAFEVIRKVLKDFYFKTALKTTDQLEIQEGLVRLIETMLSGFEALISDDDRLKERLKQARMALTEPLNFTELDIADRILTAIIVRQVEGKEALQTAQQDLKKLLFKFIEYLTDATHSTGRFQEKMEGLATQLNDTEDVGTMSVIFSEILSETNQIRVDMARSGEQLAIARQAVQDTEARIAALEMDIVKITEESLRDPTTGVLNRRGIDERLNKEILRARRKNYPLIVAAIDIDNFRRLIHHLGSKAGEETLKMLTKNVEKYLRKGDLIARYSGEEFLIVLPDTDLETARDMVVGLQRGLTKELYLNEKEPVLITFSAGIAQLKEKDSDQSLIERAIKRMFVAKKLGKNRVVGTDEE